ncbi:hypothetical protein HMPREF1548_04148 [Clostridium sp. KLE 1755]|nr:hypothetical protein HMPREF1548_04148 [Clostridium sp. KLE 1755]
MLISNEKKFFSILHEMFVSSGFTRYYRKKSDNLDECYYEKLCIHNENFLEISKEESIASVGTLIYNGSIGKKALKSFYIDYLNEGMKVRKKALGCYCIVLHVKEQYIIFTDYDGRYALYYYYDLDKFLITCQYTHIAMAIDAEVNNMALIEKGIQYCNLGKDTPFQKVFRLCGYEYIAINNGKFQISECGNLWDKFSVNESEDNLYKICCSIEQTELQYNQVFRNKTICMTGGLDSRVVLAAMIKGDDKPDIVSWQGKGLIFNSFKQDRDICERIVQELRLNIKKPDYNLDYKIEGEIKKEVLIKRLGELISIYGGNQDFFQQFEDGYFGEYVTFGYFGEPLRSNDKLDPVYHENFSLENYLDDFYINSKYSNKIKNWREYKKYIYSKLTYLTNKLGINKEFLTQEECMLLHYYYRTLADNQVCQLANIYCYSTQILAEYEVRKFILVTAYKQKKNASLQIACINKLCPQLTKIPLFSHCRMRRINTEELRIEDKGITEIEYYMKKNIEKIGKKYVPGLYDKMWGLYSKIMNPINLPSINRKITEYYLEYIEKNKNERINLDNIFNLEECEWDDLIPWLYFMTVICNY